MYLVILHLQEPQESILALCNGNKFPSVPSCSCTPHSLSYTDVRTHTHSGFPCLQSRANLRHWTQSSLSLIPLRIPRVILATSWVYIFHPQRCFHIGKKITSTPLLPPPPGPSLSKHTFSISHSFFLFFKKLFIWLHQALVVARRNFYLCYGMWDFFFLSCGM